MFAPKTTSSGAQPRKRAADGPRLGDDLAAAPARLEVAAEVRVRLAQVAGDRVDHLVGNLRSARAVEECEPALERRETSTDRTQVD